MGNPVFARFTCESSWPPLEATRIAAAAKALGEVPLEDISTDHCLAFASRIARGFAMSRNAAGLACSSCICRTPKPSNSQSTKTSCIFSCWFSAGNERMTPINHPPWLPICNRFGWLLGLVLAGGPLVPCRRLSIRRW